jgi:type III secretion protein L
MGRIVKGMGRVVPAVVLDARAEADAIRAAARGEADRARDTAQAAGSAQAAVDGAAVLVAAAAAAARLIEQARPAAKIVGRAVDLDASVMAEITAEAVAACRPRGVVRLRAHPRDLAALEREQAALLARLDGATALELVADETVGRYGCVVETTLGRVDARLDVQVAALERAIATGAGVGDAEAIQGPAAAKGGEGGRG